MTPLAAKRGGWLTFAGIVLTLAGAYDVFAGIAALANDETLTRQAAEVLFGINLHAWGWFLLCAGVLQLFAGIWIFKRDVEGLWLGVTAASISALITVFVIFSLPTWGVAVLALDILVLYGLLTRSGKFTESVDDEFSASVEGE